MQCQQNQPRERPEVFLATCTTTAARGWGVACAVADNGPIRSVPCHFHLIAHQATASGFLQRDLGTFLHFIAAVLGRPVFHSSLPSQHFRRVRCSPMMYIQYREYTCTYSAFPRHSLKSLQMVPTLRVEICDVCSYWTLLCKGS